MRVGLEEPIKKLRKRLPDMLLLCFLSKVEFMYKRLIHLPISGLTLNFDELFVNEDSAGHSL